MLEAGEQHNALIVLKNFFGAVAVVNVEIHNGNAAEAVLGNGMHGAHGHIIEEAKAHGFFAFGMVAGRADGAKGVGHFAVHHHIHGFHHRTGGIACRFKGAAVHGGVGVHAVGAHAGRHRFQVADIAIRVHARQLDVGNLVGFHFLQKVHQLRGHQPVFDGGQPLRPFRVAFTHIVAEAGGVGDKGGHAGGGEVAGEPVEHGFLLMLLLFSYYRIISWPLRLVLLRCSKMALPFQYHTSFGGK